MPHWTREPPSEPGRFWWRNTNPPHGRASYGLLLIQWASHFMDNEPPRLSVRTVVEMGGYSGESEPGSGWSFTSGCEVDRWLSDHKFIELWSEPISGPPALLPPLPGKPEWAGHPPPREAPKCSCRGRDPHPVAKDCLTPHEERRMEKISAAWNRGETVHECHVCDEVYLVGELVAVRECPHCDKRFNADDGRNCPDCNRPFTRACGSFGCPSCFDDLDLNTISPES